MPPRKRARASTASTPLRETQPKTPVEHNDGKSAVQGDEIMEDVGPDVLNDPWTDEQETQLLKGLMKWKPTGTCKRPHIINSLPCGASLVLGYIEMQWPTE